MQGLMMDYPLTLQSILDRSRRLYPKREIATKFGPSMHRYTYAAPPGAHLPEANTPLGKWHRMDEGGELIADVQDGLARLYPELADRD